LRALVVRRDMPVSVSKIDGKYRVSTPGGAKAHGTTKKKAERQATLLRAIDHGWKPTGEPASESVRTAALALAKAVLDGKKEVDKPLERSFIEPTKFGAKGLTSPEGKTAGKFRMPRNWKVGHAMKL
jgi:hypothetical protein